MSPLVVEIGIYIELTKVAILLLGFTMYTHWGGEYEVEMYPIEKAD